MDVGASQLWDGRVASSCARCGVSDDEHIALRNRWREVMDPEGFLVSEWVVVLGHAVSPKAVLTASHG